MSEVGACNCSLQARLHQVENARSREMKAHGELVQSLEGELESRRTSEAEIRLVAAKLLTDNCRLEAELCAANSKLRQLREQLDAQRSECVKRKDELKAACHKNDCLLQAARDKNEQVLEENRRINVELSEYRKQLENAVGEKELLLANIEELISKSNAQVVEIENFSAVVVGKQHEIEGSAARSKLLIDDLTNSREQQSVMQIKLQELEREIGHTVMTRNRALHWRRKRQDTWEKQLLSCRAFLSWKSISVQVKLSSAVKLGQSNEHNRARLQLVEEEVLKRCSQAKTDLNAFRQACAADCIRIQTLRDEMCQVEIPKLLAIFDMQQKNFASQRTSLESQLESQRVCLANCREQCDMSRRELEHSLHEKLKTHETQLIRQKCQKRAAFQALAVKRQRESQRRTFNVWKEYYLRSLVGQATHTAMIFSSQQPQVTAANIVSPSDVCGDRSWAMPASICPVSIAIQPLQLGLNNCTRSPVAEAATPIDEMWRKWRRVDAGIASKGQKSRHSKPA